MRTPRVEQPVVASPRSRAARSACRRAGPGSSISTSTPRSAASHECARSISSSGTKYAVAIRTRCSASWSSVRNSVSMSLLPVSDAPRTHCTTASPGLRLVGEAVDGLVEQLRVGLGPVVEERGAQPVDRGPAIRKCVSRHSSVVAALPSHSSAMPTPPVNADRLVDDHHLAVRPVVDLAEVQAAQRPEPAHLDAGVLEHVDERRARSCVRPTRRAAPAPARRARARSASCSRELAADRRPPSTRT